MRLVLPSNSSMNYFPNNTLNDFTVQLPHEVNLRGAYEVGLEEISYLQSWYTISDQDDIAFIIDRDKPWKKLAPIPPGYYSSPEQLAKTADVALRDNFKDLHVEESLILGTEVLAVAVAGTDSATIMKASKPVRISYSRYDNRMLLIIPKNKTVTLTPDTAELLGFTTIGPFKCTGVTPGASNELRMWASRAPNLQRKLHTIQVYCDLVTPHPVGDDIVPLIRYVPTARTPNEFVTASYRDVHYYPVTRNSITRVRIYIKDSEGGKVPFERGRVVVTLNLRRRRIAA